MPKKKTAHQQMLDLLASRKRSEGNGVCLTSSALKAVGQCYGPHCGLVLPQSETMEALIKQGATQPIWTPEDDAVSVEKASSKGSFKAVAGDLDIPDNALLVMRHTLTSDRKDRDRDVLHPDGAKLDPKAPLLWQHIWTLPVGKTIGIVEQSSKVLKIVSAVVDMKNQLCDDIAALVEADCLRFSHGFQALKFTQMKGGDGFDITEYDIWEASLVSIPSNVDAVVEMYAKGQVKSPQVGQFANGLSRMLRAPLGVGMDFESGSDSESTPGEKAPGCGCGGKGSGSEEPGTKDGSSDPPGDKGGTPTGEKRPGYGDFSDSYEWVISHLSRNAKSWLQGAGVSCYERMVYTVATFADSVLVCAETYCGGVQDEFKYFKGAYETDGTAVRFTGAPVEVTVEVNIVEVGQREDTMAAEASALADAMKAADNDEKRGTLKAQFDGLLAKLSETESGQQKRGAALSRSTVNTLEDVKADIQELHDADTMTRAGKALCKGCMDKLDGLIGMASSNGTGETEAPEPDQKDGDEKTVEQQLIDMPLEDVTRLKRVIDARIALEKRSSTRNGIKNLIAASRN